MKNRLPFASRLALPLIAAPMLRVSGIELVSAACASGVVGSFPTPNCRSLAELDAWLTRLDTEARLLQDAGHHPAPCCLNLIMRRDPASLRAEIECMLRHHRTEVVITSVGSPASVVPQLHVGGRGPRALRRRRRPARRAAPLGRRMERGALGVGCERCTQRGATRDLVEARL